MQNVHLYGKHGKPCPRVTWSAGATSSPQPRREQTACNCDRIVREEVIRTVTETMAVLWANLEVLYIDLNFITTLWGGAVINPIHSTAPETEECLQVL